MKTAVFALILLPLATAPAQAQCPGPFCPWGGGVNIRGSWGSPWGGGGQFDIGFRRPPAWAPPAWAPAPVPFGGGFDLRFRRGPFGGTRLQVRRGWGGW